MDIRLLQGQGGRLKGGMKRCLMGLTQQRRIAVARWGSMGVLVMVLAQCVAGSALGQVSGETTPLQGTQIREVVVKLENPSSDAALNGSVTAAVRRAFNVYPGSRYDALTVDAGLARVRRLPQIADAHYELAPANAGVSIALDVTIQNAVVKPLTSSTGWLVDRKNFPVLFVNADSLLQMKFTAAFWYQENNNAWYGQPQKLLRGNPLADSPAGAGWSGWGENYLSAGLYGITPLIRSLKTSLYGGYSYIMSDSLGQEIFTNQSRVYFGTPNDSYVGVVGGGTDASGNRLVVNASYGREHYEIGSGLLLRLSGSNGSDRAALQLNPRDTANAVGLVQMRYNAVRIEGFYEQPDDLAIVNSHTSLLGWNLDAGLGSPLTLGATYISVPQSTYTYFTPAGGALSRAGLRVQDVRLQWLPAAAKDSPYASGEFALETNRNYPMYATAGFIEAGWQFPSKPLRPSASYRYSYFSGDNPQSGTFERWDPLYSGGTLQQWVQGANHYKTFQNSNMFAQELQLILNPSPKWQVIPQLWSFRAATLNNIGGPAVLSAYTSPDLGNEANVTWKYFISRYAFAQGNLAYTTPGAAVSNAVGTPNGPWFSASGFIRLSL
jgi:hypothetical protein